MKNLIQQQKEVKEIQMIYLLIVAGCIFLTVAFLSHSMPYMALFVIIAGLISLVSALRAEYKWYTLRNKIREYDEHLQRQADMHLEDYNEYHRH